MRCWNRSLARHESGGIVLFKGKPVPKAQVVFFGPGISRGAITGEDGRFEVKAGSGSGLPAGDYEISVRPAPGGDTEIINFDRPDIPKKYWSKETSGLKESIVDGKNELKLELWYIPRRESVFTGNPERV